MSKIKKNILSAMLLAILIILSRFISIKTQFLVISFSFIPIMMAAIWLGTKYSTVIALLGDLIGAILFPFGPYFPGFTVSAAISGFIYGVCLHNKNNEISNKKLILKLTISSLLVLIIVNLFITSLWLHLLYGEAYLAIFLGRVITQVIMLPIQVIIIYILEKSSRPFMKKYILEEN